MLNILWIRCWNGVDVAGGRDHSLLPHYTFLSGVFTSFPCAFWRRRKSDGATDVVLWHLSARGVCTVIKVMVLKINLPLRTLIHLQNQPGWCKKVGWQDYTIHMHDHPAQLHRMTIKCIESLGDDVSIKKQIHMSLFCPSHILFRTHFIGFIPNEISCRLIFPLLLIGLDDA